MNKNNPPKDRTSKFLQEAYSVQTDEERQTFYSKWADEYDAQLLDELSYVGPQKTAALFMRFVADRAVRILDLGCGTGLTSVDLAAHGYQHLDGLDFSAAMLTKARERNVYAMLIEADLNLPLAIDSESYDAAVSTGTFTHGHVGAEPLDEIFRIIKPGGYLVCTVHRAIWKDHGFEEKIADLNQSGRVRTLELTYDVYFQGSTPDGMYYVLQKSE
ncbi:MAG: class I SAM-dependent methyltransferase [Gammaproteobacteria bacterium]|nr:class I SAM-dependent methyltransferase [Gammaproteobacteria bacterium]